MILDGMRTEKKTETETLPQIPVFDRQEGMFYALLIFAGGLVGAYALRLCGALATAQTGNMMSAIWAFQNGAQEEGWIRVLGVLFYAAGISISILLPPVLRERNVDWEPACLIVEIALLLTVLLIPEDISQIWRAAPIFLMGSMQFQSFPACNGVPLTTLFCTGNFRQMVVHFWAYRADRSPMALRRVLVYGASIIIYMTGVAIGYQLLLRTRRMGIYLPCAVLLLALLVRRIDKQTISKC